MKAAMVTIEIPREVIDAARMSPTELKRELALHLFEEGKLSLGKARSLAGMTVWEFQQLLGSRGITTHYDVEDYKEDIETLKKLGDMKVVSNASPLVSLASIGQRPD